MCALPSRNLVVISGKEKRSDGTAVPGSVIPLGLLVGFIKHNCSGCFVPLEAEDGHDNCSACLGLDHLREALTDQTCMNCCIMPQPVRLPRLAQLDPLAGLPSFQPATINSTEAPV